MLTPGQDTELFNCGTQYAIYIVHLYSASQVDIVCPWLIPFI